MSDPVAELVLRLSIERDLATDREEEMPAGLVARGALSVLERTSGELRRLVGAMRWYLEHAEPIAEEALRALGGGERDGDGPRPVRAA